MGFEELMNEHGSLVEVELRRYLTMERERGRAYHPLIGGMYEHLLDFSTRGGKKLAACSTLVTYEGYSGHIDDRILKVACGVEIYRHCILVHDDLVDRDLMRRGGETLHRLMIGKLDQRFGEGVSVFAGDILSSLALRSIIHSGYDPGRLLEVLNMITTEYQEVNESQVLDLLFEYKSPTVDEWRVMASKRAASLFRATILAGAMLAEAPARDLQMLREAGENIGFAFDIQDDIIDTFASEEQYGRDPCGDVLKGKKPLHIVLAMERDPEFAKLMEQASQGTRGIDPHHVRSLIASCGALEDAKKISREHADLAMDAILSTKMGETSKNFFISFLEFVKDSLDWYS